MINAGLLSVGGLYIDSAYYQPQTIAAPIIIHLGPQDLFWPRRRTETRLNLLFKPSPLLNCRRLSITTPPRPPASFNTAAILKAIWRTEHLEQHSANLGLGLCEGEAAAETTHRKKKAILLLPWGSSTAPPFQSSGWTQADHQHWHIDKNVTYSYVNTVFITVYMNVCEFSTYKRIYRERDVHMFEYVKPNR